MHPRPIDFAGAAILALVLFGLVAAIVLGSLPGAEA